MLALFLGFYRNQWNSARDKKFGNLDKFSESLIIGRLVQTRQSGIFSKAGLIGMGDTDIQNYDESNVDYQYDAYLNERKFSTYFGYRSQIGVQGMLLGLFDRTSPFSPSINLRLFRGLTSLLTALTVGLLLSWIHHEFGLFTALICFVTTLMSQWLTAFGRNLFWGIWLYFVPPLAVTFLLSRERQKKNTTYWGLAITTFATILLKCLLSGYDFISTAAIAAAVPILYYAVLDRWDWPRLVKSMFIAANSAVIAVLLSLAILAGQIGSLYGGYGKGLQHIFTSIGRRTYGDPSQFPDYSASLNASVTDVISLYLTDDVIFRNPPMRFLETILLFVFFTGIFFLVDRWKKGMILHRNKVYALSAATWLAFVGSLSTYVIFKGASYNHAHLYFIIWNLPFTIYGFALCGYVVDVIYQTLLTRRASHNEQKRLRLS